MRPWQSPRAVVMLLAAIAISGCGYPEDETGWSLTYAPPHDERILTTPGFGANETFVLSAPKSVAVGAYNGDIANGTHLTLALFGPTAMRTTLTIVSATHPPLLGECEIGQPARDVPHSVGVLRIDSTEAACTYVLDLARSISNPAGNEVTWDVRLPSGDTAGQLRFQAEQRQS